MYSISHLQRGEVIAKNFVVLQAESRRLFPSMDIILPLKSIFISGSASAV